MVKIVAHEPIGDGRLRRNGLHRRVRIRNGRRGIKPGIRNAENPDAAIVVGHVFEQPVHRVVGITAFIGCVSGLFWVVRADVHEVAFAHVAPANVLENQNIAFAH